MTKEQKLKVIQETSAKVVWYQNNRLPIALCPIVVEFIRLQVNERPMPYQDLILMTFPEFYDLDKIDRDQYHWNKYDYQSRINFLTRLYNYVANNS